MSLKSERKKARKLELQDAYGEASSWQQFKKERREALASEPPRLPARAMLPLYAAIRGMGARVQIVQPREDRHVPIRRMDPDGHTDGTGVPVEHEDVVPAMPTTPTP